MRFTQHLKYSFIVALMALVGFSCSDNTNNEDGSMATINGTVEGNASKKAKVAGVDGAVVAAARVTSSGSVEILDNTETETNASGEFTLTVDAETAQNIVIVAESEGNEWKGYVSSEIENGQSYTIKPIDMESSAESEVYAEVVASGKTEMVQKADIEAAVSGRAATEIESSSMAASRIATGLENSAEVRAEFYEQHTENPDESLEQTYQLMAEAQAQLAADLESASNAEQEENAYNVFFESNVDAFMSAGLDESSTAEAVDMWGKVYINSLTNVSSEVKNDARASASVMAAIAIDQAVQAEAEATEMSDDTKQAIVDAGAMLRAEIMSSSGIESEIEAAFEAYHDEVRSSMENDSSFNATTVIQIDTQINASSGAKASFMSSISGILDANTIVDAYNTFKSNIHATVESNVLGMTETEIEALTDIMVLINVSS